MTEDAALAMGRAAAERRMRETVTLTEGADGGFDWSTGNSTPAAGDAVYSGPARVRAAPSARGEEADAGEANVTLREYVVSLPWSTEAPVDRVRPGAVFTVDTSPDARLVGLKLWVTGVEYGSAATAWRIIAEDRS